jgi:hypothetical protein
MILFLLIINFFIEIITVYETKDKLSRITFGNFELLCKTKELNTKYINNCCKKYKKRKYLATRILNAELFNKKIRVLSPKRRIN